MTDRIYLLGTDTGVGKTAITCALLRWARRLGLTAVPFKPAQSGTAEGPSDAQRLLAASDLPPTFADLICPWSYPDPLAPGLADDAARFLAPQQQPPFEDEAPLLRVEGALRALERATQPDLVLIEGAGGLHVPMPGGTWQPMWLDRLADAAVLVTRDALGTINHTLLTFDALSQAAHPPFLGLYASSTAPSTDPSRTTNLQVITRARDVKFLGLLSHQATPDDAGTTDLLSPLLDRIAISRYKTGQKSATARLPRSAQARGDR